MKVNLLKNHSSRSIRSFLGSMNFTTKTRKIDPFSGKYLKFPDPNPKRFIGRSAIVTGGSTGVGRETSILFSHSGLESLTIADVNADKAKELVEQLNSEQKRNFAKFVQTDVSDQKQVERLFVEHMQNFGKLNILFNNAGVMLPEDSGPVDTPLEIWNRTIAINLTSIFLCCKYGIPEMLKSKGGSIINVSSICGYVGSANPQLAYTAAKSGVAGMSKELAAQYAQEGIRVNAILPGPLGTDLLKFLLDTEEKLDRRLVHFPLGRFGDAREIAQAVAFLASDESSLVTGSNFIVDGGLTSTYLTPV